MSLSAADLALRKQGLSATDVVTLATAGDGGFGTPLDVYLAKTTDAPGWAGNLRTEMGHAAEPVIMSELAKIYGLTLQPSPTHRHRILQHFLATPDRLVVDADGRLVGTCEGKLVGWRMCKRWYDEEGSLVFPDEVSVQVAWQVGVMRWAEAHPKSGVDRGYIGALLGDFGDEAFHHVVMPWEGACENLWWGLTELADRFWRDHVLARVPPTPDGSQRAREALEKIYPAFRKPILAAASPEVAALMAQYIRARDEAAAAEKEKDRLGNLIRAAIGEADVEGLRDGENKCTWKEQPGQVAYKAAAEAAGLTEAELEKYRGAPSRVLRVAPLSKKEKAYDAAIQHLVVAAE